MLLSRIAEAIFIVAVLLLLTYLLTGCATPGIVSGHSQEQGAPSGASNGVGGLTIIGGVAAAAGVGLCLVPAIGPAVGVPVAASGGTLLVLSLTLAKYGSAIALIGLVVLVGGIAIVALHKVAAYRGAFVKVIESVQRLKVDFGIDSNEANATLADAQGPRVAKLVSDTKKNANL